MKKTLVALAALAATSAFAQSSVTISGFGNLSYDLFSVAQGKAAAARTGNTSEDRVADNSSRIIFNSNEDLGGGMRAFVQVDLRPSMDAGSRLNALCTVNTPAISTAGTVSAAARTTAATEVVNGACNPGVNPLNGGNSHVGLSSSMGAIRLGRQDLHYVEGGNFAPVSQPTIHGHNGFLVAANAAAVGRASRTANLIWYTSPTFNDITATVGYSTSGYSGSGTVDVENDMASAQRKGSTKYARLGYAKGPVTAVFSWIDEKADYIGTAATAAGSGLTGSAASFAAANAQADRGGNILSLKYDLGVAKLGVAVSNTESTAMAAGAAGAKSTRRNTQFGIGIPMGASNFAVTHTTVGKLTTSGAVVADSGATALGLVYSYDLSKRTQLFAGMTTVTNQAAANQSLFYNADNAVGSAGSTAINGEKHSVTSFGVRHSF
jgi:hypothetical protein